MTYSRQFQSGDWKNATGYCYHRFANTVDNIIKWDSLLIISKKRMKTGTKLCTICCELIKTPEKNGEQKIVKMSCGHMCHADCFSFQQKTVQAKHHLFLCPAC